VTGAHPNELEERRVIRLLNELADSVDHLPAQEVDALLRPVAMTHVVRRRPALQKRASVAAAAAAAVILGTTLASTVARSPSSSTGPGTAHAQLASFPEGSALHLLLWAETKGTS
jgi:hypothetical protein